MEKITFTQKFRQTTPFVVAYFEFIIALKFLM